MGLARRLEWLTPAYWRAPPPVVAVVRLAGVIGPIGPLRRGLALAGLARTLERAFRLRRLAAVALTINSPGGSPVQASLICGRIRALAAEHDVPVYAFAEDVAASGGYWLALAGDEIYADPASIVGSIGVVTAGFGLHQALARLGIERRLHTAGAKKAMLDPFRPEDPDDLARLAAIQADIHARFQETVRARRGDRLSAPEDELFSGAFWTARQALGMGLIDGLGDLRGVLRARFGPRVRLRPVGEPRGLPFLRLRRAEAPSEAWAAGVLAAIEARALWGRFGL